MCVEHAFLPFLSPPLTSFKRSIHFADEWVSCDEFRSRVFPRAKQHNQLNEWRLAREKRVRIVRREWNVPQFLWFTMWTRRVTASFSVCLSKWLPAVLLLLLSGSSYSLFSHQNSLRTICVHEFGGREKRPVPSLPNLRTTVIPIGRQSIRPVVLLMPISVLQWFMPDSASMHAFILHRSRNSTCTVLCVMKAGACLMTASMQRLVSPKCYTASFCVLPSPTFTSCHPLPSQHSTLCSFFSDYWWCHYALSLLVVVSCSSLAVESFFRTSFRNLVRCSYTLLLNCA